MFSLRILLLLLVVSSVSGWWWGRRRRSRSRRTTIIHRPPTIIQRPPTTINCHCHIGRKALLSYLEKVAKKLKTRDVAEILDVDEDYPGFEDFAAHLDTKRDGTIDKDAFASVIKRTSIWSSSSASNSCHCGRVLLDNFKKGKL